MKEEDKKKLHTYFQANYLQENFPADYETYVQTSEGFNPDGLNNMISSHQDELDNAEQIFDGWDDLNAKVNQAQEAYAKEQDQAFTQEVIAAKNGTVLSKFKHLRGCKCGCKMKAAKEGMKVKDIIAMAKAKKEEKAPEKNKGHKYLKKKHRLA